MKKWKDTSTGRYELFIGTDDRFPVVLYCEILNDTEKYSFMVSIGGTFYHRPLTSRTLEEAKQELENWLITEYKEAIKKYESRIDFYNTKINELVKEKE